MQRSISFSMYYGRMCGHHPITICPILIESLQDQAMRYLSTFLSIYLLCIKVSAWSPFIVLRKSTPTMRSGSALHTVIKSDDTHVTTQDDVLIIGCGVLGTSLCRQLLLSSSPSRRSIVGVTRTNNNHAMILASMPTSATSSFKVATYNDLLSEDRKYPNVVFCAPPSGSEDYPKSVQDAMNDFWSGPNVGRFVFTSSGGVYGSGTDGEIVTETTPVADPNLNPRVGRLIKAEQVCIENGGSVLRLAGLYTLERGAHNYWLENGMKSIAGREDGIINLLHYDDAAGACVAALSQKLDVLQRKIFLISDGNPMTRRGICECAIKSNRYQGRIVPPFEPGPDTSKGKVYDGSWSNSQLNWRPQYPSFDHFMSQSI